MPLARVYRGLLLSDEYLRDLVNELPDIVARELTCDNPKGELVSKDIEVRVQEPNPMDIGKEHLQIVIDASYFPEREDGLDRRTEEIGNGIKKLLPADLYFFVWVRLMPSAFVEFNKC